MNKKTVKAVKSSISHHKDNLRRLKALKGEFTNVARANCFYMGNREISYDSSDCALCSLFSLHCKGCPLITCYGRKSAWIKIRAAETKKQAIKAEEGMIMALKKLLKG